MRTPNDRRTTLLALSAALLAACGGAGGGPTAPTTGGPVAPPPPPVPPPPPPAPPPGSASALAAARWSQTFVDVMVAWGSAANPLTSNLGARAFVAGHDAVNAVRRRYAPMAYAPSPDANADAVLAYAVAIHDTLLPWLEGSPAESVLVDALLREMAAAPQGAASTRAVEIGRASALAVQALRADDPTASPHLSGAIDPTPGMFRPDPDAPLALFARWAQVKPFTSAAGGSSLSAWRVPPSELTSAEYAAFFDEVKAKGVATGSTRTNDEEVVARFWAESPSIAWQRIAADWIPTVPIDLWGAARWCALIQMAIADAEVMAWEAKYHYRRWRPVSAIREADIDGNPATTQDAAWLPLGWGSEFTPAYPSAHAAGAWAPVWLMGGLSGGSPATLNVSSSTLPSIIRTLDVPDIYDNVWTEAAREMSEARLWGGLCDRQAVEAGANIGRLVGSGRLAYLLLRAA